jgi:CHRD domain/PEP-CTERM motif
MKQFCAFFSVVCGLLFTSMAQAAPIIFTANLTGSAEAPPNSSPGTGTASIVFDTTLHTLSINVTFSGFVGTTTAAHIHCCTASPRAGTAGVASQTPNFAGFPLGVTSGSYSNLYDMSLISSYNAAFIAANGGTASSAELALFNGSLAGSSYLNLHSTAFPGGEIRGFLQLASVPVPGSIALLGIGIAGMVCRKKYLRSPIAC